MKHQQRIYFMCNTLCVGISALIPKHLKAIVKVVFASHAHSYHSSIASEIAEQGACLIS